jgi:type VI secretion system protein ImpH
MAATGRRSRDPLIGALFAEPHRFHFFQAVRILEQAARQEARDPRFEPRLPVGEDADPRREAVRLRATQILSFPKSEITALAEAGTPEGRRPGPPEMTVAFLGLTGPSGVLPQHYTEHAIRSARAKSTTLRDFLDLFHHRTLSFFHRAWAKYRLPAAYERAGEGADDPITLAIFALAGFGTGHLRGRLRIADETVLHYAGLLGHWPRSAVALEDMLSDYFGRKVEISQFQGRWASLAVADQSRPSNDMNDDGAFCALGVSAVVGARVWDVQGTFRIRIGPLTLAQFNRFMPDGEDLGRLEDLARLYVGPDLGFDVQLTLMREEVPPCRLGGEQAGAGRLGWNTWLKDRPFRRDADDAVFVLGTS